MKDVALDPFGLTGSDSISASSLSAARVPMRASATCPLFAYFSCT